MTLALAQGGAAFPDGFDVRGTDEQTYLPSFDLRDGGLVLTDIVTGIRPAGSETPPYRFFCAISTAIKDPALTSLEHPAAEQEPLDRLLTNFFWLKSTMVSRRNDRLAGNQVPSQPINLFNDRGKSLKQLFRVFDSPSDSNFDGKADHLQLADPTAEGDPYDMDVDNDGIPNGYDQDMWIEREAAEPGAQYADTIARLGNLLINEVLHSNEFTNADDDQECHDWIELYNPTDATITLCETLSNPANPIKWYLSDDRDRLMRWSFPEGTEIASGEFLVVWASGKNRGGVNPPMAIHTSDSLKPGNPATPSDPEGILLTNTAGIIPPASGGTVHVTFNCATPSRYSEIYRLPIETDHTLVVRAVAAKPGYYPSSSITRSFLFREDILGTAPAGSLPTDHQGSRDASTGEFQGYLYGYPEATEDLGFPLLYKMNPAVIRDFKPTLETELSAVPIVSVVGDVSDLFDFTSAGIYPNSEKPPPVGGLEPDPRSRDWQRLCSFEWMEEDGSGSKQENACLEISVDTSVLQRVSRKHNLKLRFHSSHGPKQIVYKLFNDADATEFSGFGLKNPTQDSWAQHSGISPLRPNTFNWVNFTQAATYCGEGWLRSAHRLMGHPGPHRRWVHLFLNGIYWGPYELTERVDDDYLERHSTIFGDPEFDVLKELGDHGVEAPDEDEIPAALRVRDFENKVRAIDGYTGGWTTLIADCTSLFNAVSADAPLQTQDTLYTNILTQIDIDNYIDYLLCYAFSAIADWPTKNYRIGRRADGGDRRFRFYVWDAELSFAPGENRGSELTENWVRLILESGLGVAKPHQLLCLYSRYRQRFAERISYHFFEHSGLPGSGCLALTPSGDRAAQLFQDQMATFQPVLYSESARWGDSRKATPFTFSDPSYLPGDIRKGDWQRTTSYILNTWLPQRRRVVFDHLAGHDLYVAVKTADVDDVTIPGERSLVALLPTPQVGSPIRTPLGSSEEPVPIP